MGAFSLNDTAAASVCVWIVVCFVGLHFHTDKPDSALLRIARCLDVVVVFAREDFIDLTNYNQLVLLGAKGKDGGIVLLSATLVVEVLLIPWLDRVLI